ncbi:MAG TPA: phytanoyl-CoA dioxygenase family protein [Fimbriimonadaceae bacterium]|nr:phytanoyl-CoA dioxygenase family protein [Fimbriimonadaceae bacterium]
MDQLPYQVSVEEYRRFRRDGYLVVRGLVSDSEIEEMQRHIDDLIAGRVHVDGLEEPKPGETLREVERRLLRIHMMHDQIPLWEQWMLHPRVLDVVQALIGPDVLAMQTMMFIKGPGSDGQGFHQDSYYIPTFPDSLLGAWIAVDPADRQNGCLWMTQGSQVEPIYPPANGYGYGDWGLKDIPEVSGVGGHSNSDEDPDNGLRSMTLGYEEVPVELEPGDAAFFGGHVLHRSLSNKTSDRSRRAFVNHYCNARSFTSWGGGNQNHILARGNTHLEFAKPKFGTPCAALDPQPSLSDRGAVPTMMMATPEGDMAPQEPALADHDH